MHILLTTFPLHLHVPGVNMNNKYTDCQPNWPELEVSLMQEMWDGNGFSGPLLDPPLNIKF